MGILLSWGLLQSKSLVVGASSSCSYIEGEIKAAKIGKGRSTCLYIGGSRSVWEGPLVLWQCHNGSKFDGISVQSPRCLIGVVFHSVAMNLVRITISPLQ